YVNEKVIVLDKDTITASDLLELAGFSSLVYDIYLKQNEARKNNGKKINKPLSENRKIEIEIGMHFDALLEEN
nr:hypothetical protein [Nitrosopumilus sp.]